MDVNEERLNALLGKFVGDLGATKHAGSIVIGEKLGLYKAMSTPEERVSAAELARRTGTNERYVREWLNAQAASGYVEYDPEADSYYLTPEQSFVMTNENNPAYLPGAFILAISASAGCSRPSSHAGSSPPHALAIIPSADLVRSRPCLPTGSESPCH